MKKYEITDIAHPDNPNLHRIRAVTDLTEDVLAGMLGGYVESYDNLDQEGRAWISADAIACENAVVCGDAVLTDHAVAKGCAYVGKNATVMGDATVQDDAIVCGGLLTGKSCVCGYAVIRQDEQTLCAPTIDGSTRIYGEISGNVVCRGNAVVLPGTKPVSYTHLMQLIGQDGNIFAIMGRASRLLKSSGQGDKAKEMRDRVMSCDSYQKALSIVSEYVETELSPSPTPKRDRGDAR